MVSATARSASAAHAYVGAHGVVADAQPRQLLGRVLQAGLVAAGYHHLGAGLPEGHGAGAPDAGSTAGNQYYFVFHLETPR